MTFKSTLQVEPRSSHGWVTVPTANGLRIWVNLLYWEGLPVTLRFLIGLLTIVFGDLMAAFKSLNHRLPMCFFNFTAIPFLSSRAPLLREKPRSLGDYCLLSSLPEEETKTEN